MGFAFIIFIVFMLISSISVQKGNGDVCKVHVWRYDDSDNMRCVTCRKTPSDCIKS